MQQTAELVVNGRFSAENLPLFQRLSEIDTACRESLPQAFFHNLAISPSGIYSWDGDKLAAITMHGTLFTATFTLTADLEVILYPYGTSAPLALIVDAVNKFAGEARIDEVDLDRQECHVCIIYKAGVSGTVRQYLATQYTLRIISAQ